MNEQFLATSVSALSNIIYQNFNDNEIALLSALFVQLGDTLATLLAAKALNE